MTEEEERLAGLNPAQREAVLHVRGPLLVLAGAGSGKTRVLTTRITRLIEIENVDPRQILAVTFTNRAAAHLAARTPSFTIYDQDDSGAVVKRLMERHRIPHKQFAPRAIQSAISD